VRTGQAGFEAELGNLEEARRQNQAAFAMTNDKGIRSGVALALARTGDLGRAEKLIADLAKEYPADSTLNNAALPIARAAIALQRKQPADAVKALEAARPFEMGSGPTAPIDFWALYLRAEAYSNLHDAAKAVGEYQRIADHRGLSPTSPLYVLARLGAARAAAQGGDAAKARTAYQDFFAFWKDADPDVPVLKQAKAEYEKLH
jgi:tetratricopeptide (TPR) repeat protein